MKITRNRIVTGVVFSLATASCGVSPDSSESASSPAPATDRIKALNQDLALGSQGDAVRAVHESLTQFGYYPNDQLAKSYPAWQPVVATPPADPSVYDEHTADAVRAYQANTGLPQTGIVDQATRNLMVTPRCGVPDGIVRFDSSDKFAIGGKFNSPISWNITGTDDGLSLSTVHNAALFAVNTWIYEMNLDIHEDSGNATIPITFSSSLTYPTIALTNHITGAISLATWVDWSNGVYDLQTVILHEFGHALGLLHSSFPLAAMYGPQNLTYKRNLNIDDKVAISTQYDQWNQLPGSSISDVGVGYDGAAWIIGGNNTIWKWNGSNWTYDQFGLGKRIAGSPDNRPYLVGMDNGIYRRTTSDPLTGYWQLLPGGGCATDIGVGGDGSLWAISCNPGYPDGSIFRFNGSGWIQKPGGCVHIAVGPTGIPWCTNSSYNIYRIKSDTITNHDPMTGTWEQVGGNAMDIGISMFDAINNTLPYNVNAVPTNNSYTWIIGTSYQGNGDYSIHALDQQPAGPGSPPAPAEGQWIQVPGGARNIAVGPKGEPWIVNYAGYIFKPNK